MKNNKNKLFGGMGPEKAGELGGNAPHKCRGRECDEASHADSTHAKDKNNQGKSKSATTHKSGAEHTSAERSKATTNNKKD